MSGPVRGAMYVPALLKETEAKKLPRVTWMGWVRVGLNWRLGLVQDPQAVPSARAGGSADPGWTRSQDASLCAGSSPSQQIMKALGFLVD